MCYTLRHVGTGFVQWAVSASRWENHALCHAHSAANITLAAPYDRARPLIASILRHSYQELYRAYVWLTARASLAATCLAAKPPRQSTSRGHGAVCRHVAATGATGCRAGCPPHPLSALLHAPRASSCNFYVTYLLLSQDILLLMATNRLTGTSKHAAVCL
jgi:hypothetical protein